MNLGKYKKQLRRQRQEKDRFFGSHPESPLNDKEQENFTGLNYFEPDLNYRFTLALKEFEQKETLRIQDTAGEMRKFFIWGEFNLNINDKACVLFTYKSNKDEKGLFIPFKDATNGEETYDAGRYLDLPENAYDTNENKWLLDFNLATNPWCVYNPNYACPLIPVENILKVRIEAGEKNYKKN